MIYREAQATGRFANVVKCYWSIEQTAAKSAVPEPVFPDGCPEIVFNLADRFRRYYSTEDWETQARTLIAGQMSRNILIAPSGHTQLFGIRLHPYGANSILSIGLRSLKDHVVDGADVFGAAEAEMYERVAAASSFEARIAVFESMFLPMLYPNCIEIRRAVEAIDINAGAVRISRLARKLGWSERRLERRFSEYVGIAPKLYSRIARFQSLVRGLDAGRPLADAALSAGYYDQPHMNREFSEFAGLTPTEYINSRFPISEALISAE
jgi:AraC-like DNA-binding protein